MRTYLAVARPWVALTLAIFALIIAWHTMERITRSDRWYHNANMNVHNMADALAINSGFSPAAAEYPGFVMKYLLALDYRMRGTLSQSSIWNMEQFAEQEDPLRSIPSLIHAGHAHSRILIVISILAAAGLIYTATKDFYSSCLGIVLLSGCSGLLFHGLLIRPELLCYALGGLFASCSIWKATASPVGRNSTIWLFITGGLAGLATLENSPGAFYFIYAAIICWIMAGIDLLRSAPSAHPLHSIRPAEILLPLISSAALLGLLAYFDAAQFDPDPNAVNLLRWFAIMGGLLPLFGLTESRHPITAFLLARAREFSVLVSGAIFSIIGCYLLIRAMMPEITAGNYFSSILGTLPKTGLFLIGSSPENPNLAREILHFLKESPALFLGTTLWIGYIVTVKSVPVRLKAFTVSLWFSAIMMTCLLAAQRYGVYSSVFVQVPLLLCWVLGIFSLVRGETKPNEATASHWSMPIIVTASIALLLASYFRVKPRYDYYQPDTGHIVNDLTLTYLYDHDAHPDAYLNIMARRYQSRQHFAKVLESYLDEPGARFGKPTSDSPPRSQVIHEDRK